MAKRKVSSIKYDLRPIMKVESGALQWEGRATDSEEALIKAFMDLPDNPSRLVRFHDGRRWQYVDLETALRTAGYKVRVTKRGIFVD